MFINEGGNIEYVLRNIFNHKTFKKKKTEEQDRISPISYSKLVRVEISFEDHGTFRVRCFDSFI